MTHRHWPTGRSRATPISITADVLEKCLDRVARAIDQAGDKGADPELHAAAQKPEGAAIKKRVSAGA